MYFRPILPDIKDVLNINEQNMEWIRNKLKSGTDIAEHFDTVINKLATARATMPFEEQELISPSTVLTALQQYGIDISFRENEMDYETNKDFTETKSFPSQLNFGDSAHLSLAMSYLPSKCECLSVKILK